MNNECKGAGANTIEHGEVCGDGIKNTVEDE